MSQSSRNADAFLPASPETVIWGAIDAARKPVLHVRAGQTVRIDTVSQQPLNPADPATFFPANGIRADEVLPEIGKPPKRPLATFATPRAPISWLAST